MKFQKYLVEKKKLGSTMIGFPINPSQISRVKNYIESWLIRNKISYDSIDDPHFTIVQITGTYDKDELKRELDKIKNNLIFKPSKLSLFRGIKVPKDFISLEYKPNNEFVGIFKMLSGKYEIRQFSSIKPHISLFSIKKDSIDDQLLGDIIFHLPNIPNIKSKEIGLWNRNFQLEYKK